MAKKIQSHRRSALLRQGGRCFYCRFPVWEADSLAFAKALAIPHRLAGWLRCTAEHLCARCEGGSDGRGNIVAACYWCNSRRHRKSLNCISTTEVYSKRVRSLVAAGKWHPVAQHKNAGAK